ncbi:hypothetical protein ACFQ1L_43130 [Phytohabitans flavus]|uniref:Membrane transport protein MMPL domain-containing protein n=1 Tax=Phytohabitans flavus TaxID=1076124 RepID=A0A6F8Y862_9ACTN|nr:hypothetical protein [Phytohabitans flavus]BCB82250.1 hypothetical protein Pflav_086600 [Phytohabitans flavus]
MFSWWGGAVVRLRWAVLAAAAVLVVVGATWGAGVFGKLTGGGFEDPASESTKARERIMAELGNQDVDVLVLYSSETATVDQPAFRDPVTTTLTRLRELPEVASVTSWYELQGQASSPPTATRRTRWCNCGRSSQTTRRRRTSGWRRPSTRRA